MKILLSTLLLLGFTACISYAQVEEFPATANVFTGDVEVTGTLDSTTVLSTADVGIFGNLEVWDFWDFKVAGQFTGAVDFLSTVDIAGAFTVENGVNVGDGVDADVNVFTVDVTGSPAIDWRESTSQLEVNAALLLDPAAGYALTVDSATGNDTGITNTGVIFTDRLTGVISAAQTSFQAAGNFMRLTSVTSETIATITQGVQGQVLYLMFNNSNVTITDDNSGTADTVDLSAAFTGAADTVLTLIYDGTSWYEVSRSVN